MKFPTAVLNLFAAASLRVSGVTAADFNGTGQLRTLWNDPTYMGRDLGCITAEGLWTIDEELCGVFEGTWDTSVNQNFPVQVQGSEGYCHNSPFDCTFATIEEAGFISWVDIMPNDRGVLASPGMYGIYASATGNNPPLEGELSQIRFYSSEVGKYVWLGWKAL